MDITVASEIRSYYERAPERDRLETGVFQLEFARTKQIIDRFLPSSPAVVYDVGGGPGRYSSWLAKRGFRVHLIDPVLRLVAEAQELADEIESCQVGDARSLPYGDSSADALLLLGPLYHLVSRADRICALREAYRVLKPGGLIYAAGVSRFASALDGLARDLFADANFVSIVERDLASGVHENPTNDPAYFTTAKFHRPEELEEEVASAGFVLHGVIGIEGPGWIFPDFDSRWRNPRQREDLMRMAAALETEVSVRGMSAHLLAVGKRP